MAKTASNAGLRTMSKSCFGPSGVHPSPEIVKQFREFQGSARAIYERRLAVSYVSPSAPTPLPEVPDEEVDRIIGLADVRTTMEERNKRQELKPEEMEELRWFQEATEHPLFSSFIFKRESLEKLAAFKGDVRQWVRWLRVEIERLESLNRELLEREMERQEPRADEALKPKWRLSVRLVSQSHSIRSKPLAAWNKRSKLIQLRKGNVNELIVEFTLPKRIAVSELWNAGWHHSNVFAIALNIASCGFFGGTFLPMWKSFTNDASTWKTRPRLNSNCRLPWP